MRYFGLMLLFIGVSAGAAIQPKPEVNTPIATRKTFLFQQAPVRFMKIQAQEQKKQEEKLAKDLSEQKDAAQTTR